MTRHHPSTVGEDRDSRRLAQREFSTPLVIEAGAGTGKTALLVARVVAWCMGEGWARHEGDGAAHEQVARRVIEGVVAITFTEAAAAEMARKIGEALSGLARGEAPIGWDPDTTVMPESDAETRNRAGCLSDEVHRLAVSTIHSFCQRLLSAYPLEAGLHPRFVVDAEEEATDSVVVAVVEEALRGLDRDPRRADWEVLAGAGIDPPRIAVTIQYLVTNGLTAEDLDRDPFTDELARRTADDLLCAVRAFEAAEGGSLQGLSKGASISIGARDIVLGLAAEIEMLGPTPTFAEVAALANGRGSKELKRLADWGRGTFITSESRCLGDRERAVAEAAAALSPALVNLSRLHPLEFNAARRVIRPLVEEVERRRSSRGLVSYNDLLFRAAKLVESSPGIVRELCSRIDQLLVDEFQDTDAVQCRLVEALAFGEGGRPGLFVVGDPKQSIYAWRNADLAAYESFVATVERHGGARHPLVRNFRSVEPILDEVSEVVGEVMVEEANVQPPFVPLLPTEDRVGASGFSAAGRSAVEYWVAWPPSPEGEDPAPAKSGVTTAWEAGVLARDIRELAHSGGVRWGDIAVLLRATTAQEDLLEAFRELGIPYEVAREKEFYRQREVVEAAALVRCVVDPSDVVALLTVMRSDVVGVPDRALAPLWDAGFPNAMARLDGSDPETLETVHNCIRQAADRVPDRVPASNGLTLWSVSLEAAVRAIAELREAFAREAPDRFVERMRTLWLAEVSAAARFLGRFRRARLERFYTDLERRLGVDEGGVAGLARYLRQSVQDGQSGAIGGEPDLQADAVHVMTIHGAKGLDFKHVYLVQVHRTSGAVEDPLEPQVLPAEGGREYRLFGWPSLRFGVAQELKKRQARAETVRLLYVAMTRAKDRLVVSGGWNSPAKGKGPLAAAGFSDLLEGRNDLDALGEQIESKTARRLDFGGRCQWFVPALEERSGEEGGETAEIDHGLRDLSGIRRDAGEIEAARSAAESRMARPLAGGASSLEGEGTDRHDEEDGGTVEGAVPERDVAIAVGSAVHSVMEHVDLEGDLSSQLRNSLDRAVQAFEGCLDGDEIEEATDRFRTLIDRISEGKCLARLGSVARSVVGREVAIVAPPLVDLGPTGAITGFVDLVYTDPDDGRLVVADFKTDHIEEDGALAGRVTLYEPQVRTYARALREALDLDHEPHVELWFLSADRIVRL